MLDTGCSMPDSNPPATYGDYIISLMVIATVISLLETPHATETINVVSKADIRIAGVLVIPIR
jgi:hypothetical protein